jgi:hypothetical protein
MPKRLELLSELIPQAKVFALFVNPEAANAEAVIRNIEDAARARRVELYILKASTLPDIDVQIQPHGVLDDDRRKPMPTIGDRSYARSLRRTPPIQQVVS